MSFALAVFSTATHAAERLPGWYVGLGANVDFISETDYSVRNHPSGPGTGLEYDSEIDSSVRASIPDIMAGYRFGNVRLEAELVGRAISHDIKAGALMMNSYYDFYNDTRFTPFIGAGAGIASLKVDDAPLDLYEDSSEQFAYQFMAGVSYAPEMLPNTDWSIAYNYFATQDASYDSADGAQFIDIDGIQSHGVKLGVLYNF